MRFWKRPPTFETLAHQVLELKKLKSRNTFLSAKTQLTRLIRHFGSIRIDRISESSWNQYVLLEQSKKPGRRMYDDKKYMRMVLLYALREGFTRKKTRLTIPDRPTDIGRELSKPEVDRLLENSGPELRLQIEMALKMGLRKNEMLHLRWDQFDWETKTIRVYASKTHRSRTNPINPDLLTRLKDRRASSSSSYVFCRYQNKRQRDPTRPQSSNKTAWKRVKRLAGVRARWHDLRHTSATWMLRRGIKLHVVRILLGMSEKVLLQIYAHLNEDDMWMAARVMSDAQK